MVAVSGEEDGMPQERRSLVDQHLCYEAGGPGRRMVEAEERARAEAAAAADGAAGGAAASVSASVSVSAGGAAASVSVTAVAVAATATAAAATTGDPPPPPSPPPPPFISRAFDWPRDHVFRVCDSALAEDFMPGVSPTPMPCSGSSAWSVKTA